MLTIHLHKSRVQEVMQAIIEGSPIPSGDSDGWKQSDMLLVAGALYFAAFSHGPMQHTPEGVASLHAERREAVENIFTTELHGAIEFYSGMARRVVDDQFSDEFEDEVMAILSSEDTSSPKWALKPVKGFRQCPDAT